MKNITREVIQTKKHTRSYLMLALVVLLATNLLACSSAQTNQATTAAATTQIKLTDTTTVAGETTTNVGQTTAVTTEKTFTLAELAQFDGLNGNPAYIAYDGVVYDVSAIKEWKTGTHVGEYPAGKDYTKELAKAPHGTTVLQQAVIVGTLVV